jgi:ATP-dependent DNA ligase
MLTVTNMPEALAGVRFTASTPCPAPDPRFVRGPSELCCLAVKWDGTVPSGGLIVQEKIDGIRAAYFDGQLWTREGNAIGGVDHILAELHAIEWAFGRPMFLDGEFQVDGALKPTLAHFARRGRYGDAGRLNLFDALPLDQWRADACTIPLSARLSALQAVMGKRRGEHVSALPSCVCGSPDAVRAYAGQIWARGGEGAVAKAPDSLYRRRRDAAWMKAKRSTA